MSDRPANFYKDVVEDADVFLFFHYKDLITKQDRSARKVTRDLLRNFFESGDMPIEEEFPRGVPEPYQAALVANYMAQGFAASITWKESDEGPAILYKGTMEMFRPLCKNRPYDFTTEPEELPAHAKPAVANMPLCHDFK